MKGIKMYQLSTREWSIGGKKRCEGYIYIESECKMTDVNLIIFITLNMN